MGGSFIQDFWHFKMASNKKIKTVDLGSESSSDSDIECLSPLPKKKLIKFISEDPQENEDNNDQRWDSLRKLETPREFKDYCQRKFDNDFPADPERNLTYHGFKRYIYGYGGRGTPSP